MRAFAALCERLDEARSAADRVSALRAWLSAAAPADIAAGLHLLRGGKITGALRPAALKRAACVAAQLEVALLDDCVRHVGDLAEAIALVLPDTPADRPQAQAAVVGPTRDLAADAAARHDGSAAPTIPAVVALSDWLLLRLPSLRQASATVAHPALLAWWAELPRGERAVLTRLVSGWRGRRTAATDDDLLSSLAEHARLDRRVMAQRLAKFPDPRGAERPTARHVDALLASEAPMHPRGQPGPLEPHDASLPHPFSGVDLQWPCQATGVNPTTAEPVDALQRELGPCSDWHIEWQYDGLRVQLVRHAGGVALWTRDHQLITDRFPEIARAAADLPTGTVLDGEMLVWRPGAAQPEAWEALQARLGRKAPGPAVRQQTPVRLLVFDAWCIEDNALDDLPFARRREALVTMLQRAVWQGSELVPAPAIDHLPGMDWPQVIAIHTQARSRGAEGVMLKRRGATLRAMSTPFTPSAPCTTPSPRENAADVPLPPNWVAWRCPPIRLHTVLLYAQAHPDHPAASLELTLGVWNHPPASADAAEAVLDRIVRGDTTLAAHDPHTPPPLGLLSLVKVGSIGLPASEQAALAALIRATTVQKFGPVRSLRPSAVVTLQCAHLARHPRHRSGLSVRGAHILHWTADATDLAVWQAHSLEELAHWLPDAR